MGPVPFVLFVLLSSLNSCLTPLDPPSEYCKGESLFSHLASGKMAGHTYGLFVLLFIFSPCDSFALREAGGEDRGVERFHLNRRSISALDLATGLAFGGHRLGGNTCL